MAVRLSGGRMDQKETHKCFSSKHVWKTDIKAALLDPVAERSESASGEGFGLLGASSASPVGPARRPRPIRAVTQTFVNNESTPSIPWKTPLQQSSIPTPSWQHKQITSMSLFIISTRRCPPNPPAGLHHRDPR